jgi:hypothetical protein
MDVKTDTARDLVFAARRFKWNPRVYDQMLDHGATFDRTVGSCKATPKERWRRSQLQ